MSGTSPRSATRAPFFCAARGVVAACAFISSFVADSPSTDLGRTFTFVRTAEAGEDAPIVTFTGLRVHEDRSSTVFVDLTRSTKVEAKESGKEVSFLLSGAKIRTRNNKNPLIAEYFKTNLLRASLVDDAKGVRLVVQLREAVKTEHDMNLSEQGARLLVKIPAPASP